ncbi:hypothetical protein EV363DRAFT_928808 [Boletus edulis]|nr:hypothetical protein EV363DRAFT_928808 [Boletus edulis]
MTDTTGWTFVDDRDPGIAFSLAPGDASVYGGMPQEYDQTTTGLNAGDTATYYFNASSIGVFGTYDVTGDSGPPISVYQVDDAAATTVTAPVTQTTLYRQNFWTSPQLPSLDPGALHTLVITAMAPNDTLWLDYLAYPPDPLNTTSFEPINVAPTATSASNTIPLSSTTDAGSPTASASNTIPLSSTTNAGFQTASASGTTTFSPTPTTTAEAQLAPAASNTKNNIGAIAASIVVGAVAFVLAIAALVYVRSRRGSLMRVGETDPYPNMFENSPVILIQAEYPPSEDAPPYPSLDLQQADSPQDQHPRHVPVRSFDGGVRLNHGGPLEVPPAYREHY